jgi:spore maturation protein CgeB
MNPRIVVLGHALSQLSGNAHADAYRTLLAALAGRGHDILFLERNDVVAEARRDAIGWCNLQFYDSVAGLDVWRPRLADADLVMLDPDVPEGIAVARLAFAARGGMTALFDIDTPRTLARLAAGGDENFAPDLVPQFDLYLASTGGAVPRALEKTWRASAARALFPSADPTPRADKDDDGAESAPRWDLGYLGDFAPESQPLLERLLIEPARRMPARRFVVAGAGWPTETRWPANVDVIAQPAAPDRAAFDARLRWSLVLARPDHAAAGWTPGARLFEAAAHGVAIISDPWRGLAPLFTPGTDIVVAASADDVIRAIGRADGFRAAIARAGRARVRIAHTPAHRAAQLQSYVAEALRPRGRAGAVAKSPGRRRMAFV